MGKNMGESVFKRNTFIILVVISSLGVMTSLSISSKWGIGINEDSVVYINAARNLLNGLGLSTIANLGGLPASTVEDLTKADSLKPRPLTHFPPLYPLLLYSLGILGVDPIMGGRYIAAFLFGANIMMVALIIHRIRASLRFSIFGSLLILTSQAMIRIHIYAWSEPLFIFLGLLGLYFLRSYLLNGKVATLIYSAVAISLAFMSRYVGLSLIITGIIGILSLSAERYKNRIIHCAMFGVIGCAPIGLWVIRNLYLGGSATNREFYFHPLTYGALKSGLFEVCSWIFPYGVPTLLRVIAFLLLVTAFILIDPLAKRKEKSEFVNGRIIYFETSTFFGMFIAVYLGFLVFSFSFFDALSNPIDDRYLSPIYAPLVIVVVEKIRKIFIVLKNHRIIGRGVVLICVGFLVFNLIRTFRTSIGQYEDGAYSYNNKFNYNSRFWEGSEIIKILRKLPGGTLLYTNVPDAIYIMTGRSAYKIPAKENAINRKPNSKYLSQLDSMNKEINSREGLLVYFDTGYVFNVPSEEELSGKLHLVLDKRYKEGSIYRGGK